MTTPDPAAPSPNPIVPPVILPPTTATTSLRHSLVNKPDNFDGAEARYPSWKQQVMIYVFANATAFTNDVSKVIIVLSFMKEGKAGRFAEAAFNNMMETTPALWLGSWKDFWEQMDNAFLPADSGADAARELDAWTQGNRSADEYFVVGIDLELQEGRPADELAL